MRGTERERIFSFSFYFLSHAVAFCLIFDSLKEGICLISLYPNNYNLHILSYFSSLWVESKWEKRCLSCYDTHKEISFAHGSTLISRVARDVKPYWVWYRSNAFLLCHSSLWMDCAHKLHPSCSILLFLPLS